MGRAEQDYSASRFDTVVKSEAMAGLFEACEQIAEDANRLLDEERVSLEDYRAMLEMRRMEEELERLKVEGEVVPNIHQGIGQEAVAWGAVGSLLKEDYLTATYRGRCHAMAKGAPLKGVIAEVLNRATGLSAGRGGPMHMIDARCNLLFESAIVGGAAPLAVGAALTAKRLGQDRVAMTVFGEGATAQGVLHEALNLAGVWQLPVIFICEDNGYSEMTPSAGTTALQDFSWRSLGHGVPALRADGNALSSIRAAARAAINWARAGRGPVFITASTYRLCGHYAGEPGLYRPQGELEAWSGRDPLTLAEATLLGSGASDDALARVRSSVEADIAEAVTEALEAHAAEPSSIYNHVYGSGNS